jgi:hypothetical protein
MTNGSFNDWKTFANRTGNKLFVAGATVASMGKEKSKKAFEMSKEKIKTISTVGANNVRSTHVFQVAFSVSNVGKDQAKKVASVASAGKKKVKNVLTIATQHISRGKTKSQSPLSSALSRIESVDKEYYRYEMSAEEKKKKRAQAKKGTEKFAPSSPSFTSRAAASSWGQRAVTASSNKSSLFNSNNSRDSSTTRSNRSASIKTASYQLHFPVTSLPRPPQDIQALLHGLPPLQRVNTLVLTF